MLFHTRSAGKKILPSVYILLFPPVDLSESIIAWKAFTGIRGSRFPNRLRISLVMVPAEAASHLFRDGNEFFQERVGSPFFVKEPT